MSEHKLLGDIMKITKIWFEFDEWENGFNEDDDNSDVNFELDDGSKWCAEFFTYKNLITISQKNRHTGECLAGQYFQSNKAIFISKMNKDLIVSVLNEIIQNERDLTSVFTAINN